MVNWKQKLSSRKFQAFLLNELATVLGVLNFGKGTIEQIICVAGAILGVFSYLVAETAVDIARAKASVVDISEKEGGATE